MLRHAGGDSAVPRLVEAGTGMFPPGRVRKPWEGRRVQRLSWGLKSQLSTEEAPTIEKKVVGAVT